MTPNPIHNYLHDHPIHWKPVLAWVGLFALLYGAGLFIPQGFDWVHFFGQGAVSPIWTPWSAVVVKFLNWPLLVAITLFALIYRTYRYNPSPLPIVLALLSLPTVWLMILGNLDGLVLAGLLLMPWGVPLVTMKPQLSTFALFAKKKWFIAAAIWGVLTLLIWGLWPQALMGTFAPDWRAEWVQDISLFPWGAIVALPLLWFSRGDEDLLMAAGSFITPHLFPYHFYLLMPALGRMKPGWMILTWLLSWTPLLANWLGNIGWHAGNVFALVLWMGVYFSKPRQKKIDPEAAAS
ncbi:hypothetical protein LARV_00336 [Longilinea arvoryzae]|uniref:Uncharacterized protein n=1 Tax=Longilinea arvoryzae TaxID=360412 RepID=A0A0S7BEX3_9CHLR|nr:hypothetical protein [Longilinea arvoryzae]GAP12600.1 hypothetical protein LARV_00336 [Longilinea arvoryzae]